MLPSCAVTFRVYVQYAEASPHAYKRMKLIFIARFHVAEASAPCAAHPNPNDSRQLGFT